MIGADSEIEYGITNKYLQMLPHLTRFVYTMQHEFEF